MGASSSFLVTSNKSNKGYASDKTGSDRTNASMSSNPNIGSNKPSISLSSSVITPGLIATCVASWDIIDPPSRKLDHESKLIQFCQRFFIILETLDTSTEVRAKFKPRRQSSILTRSGLLVRIIKYMLSVPSDSFKVKAKIRALGRSHATRGIVERHFTVFCSTLVCCLQEMLQLPETDVMVEAWRMLLTFFVEQLTFDKIVFVSHHTSEDAAAALLRAGSSNTSVNNSNNNINASTNGMDVNDGSEPDRILPASFTMDDGASTASGASSFDVSSNLGGVQRGVQFKHFPGKIIGNGAKGIDDVDINALHEELAAVALANSADYQEGDAGVATVNGGAILATGKISPRTRRIMESVKEGDYENSSSDGSDKNHINPLPPIVQ